MTRFGKKKVEADKKKNWVMEVPDRADPFEDQFAKASEAKKERIAKNEYLRLRNIARSKNLQIPHVGVTSINTKTSKQVSALFLIHSTVFSTTPIPHILSFLHFAQIFTYDRNNRWRHISAHMIIRETDQFNHICGCILPHEALLSAGKVLFH